MTRLGRLSLPSFLQTYLSSRENRERIRENTLLLFTYGALRLPYIDSIRLRLFQRTLTGLAAKWYIELPRGAFALFDNLAMTFLNHFQLPVHYDVGTKLLSTFRQDKATHISNHIQEWRRWKRLIKANIPP